MKSRYNPNSPRSLAGKKFQNTVLKELQESDVFINVEDTRARRRSYGINNDMPYTEQQLSIYEKSFGDITFLSGDRRFYVECCLAMGDDTTSLCEIKRTRFVGENKWYCYGKRLDPDSRVFIHSTIWHKYMGQLELNKRNGWTFRTIPIEYIGPHIRSAIIGQKDFENYLVILNEGG